MFWSECGRHVDSWYTLIQMAQRRIYFRMAISNAIFINKNSFFMNQVSLISVLRGSMEG